MRCVSTTLIVNAMDSLIFCGLRRSSREMIYSRMECLQLVSCCEACNNPTCARFCTWQAELPVVVERVKGPW